jgi:23S rRNA (adenine2503-C2)-methyltransferase
MNASAEGQTLVGMELSDLKKVLGPEQPAYRARQLYDALYRKQVANLSEILALPQELRNQLLSGIPLGLLKAEQRYDSTDGTRRYLLRLGTNA